MPGDMLQFAFVTLVAVAAGAVVVRRALGFIRPRAGHTGCAACPSAEGACAPSTQATGDVSHPAVLIRPSSHGTHLPR